MTPTIQQNYRGKDKRRGLLLKTDFDELFVNELKTLPARDRFYDPIPSGWWVDSRLLDEVVRLTLRYWPTVLLIGRPGTGEDDQFISRDGSRSSQARLAL